MSDLINDDRCHFLSSAAMALAAVPLGGIGWADARAAQAKAIPAAVLAVGRYARRSS